MRQQDLKLIISLSLQSLRHPTNTYAKLSTINFTISSSPEVPKKAYTPSPFYLPLSGLGLNHLQTKSNNSSDVITIEYGISQEGTKRRDDSERRAKIAPSSSMSSSSKVCRACYGRGGFVRSSQWGSFEAFTLFITLADCAILLGSRCPNDVSLLILYNNYSWNIQPRCGHERYSSNRSAHSSFHPRAEDSKDDDKDGDRKNEIQVDQACWIYEQLRYGDT